MCGTSPLRQYSAAGICFVLLKCSSPCSSMYGVERTLSMRSHVWYISTTITYSSRVVLWLLPSCTVPLLLLHLLKRSTSCSSNLCCCLAYVLLTVCTNYGPQLAAARMCFGCPPALYTIAAALAQMQHTLQRECLWLDGLPIHQCLLINRC